MSAKPVHVAKNGDYRAEIYELGNSKFSVRYFGPDGEGMGREDAEANGWEGLASGSVAVKLAKLSQPRK